MWVVEFGGRDRDLSTLTPFTDDLTDFIGESAIAEFDGGRARWPARSPDAARLRFTPATWGDGPGQVINLDQNSDRTIAAWVSECEVGPCRLQCEEDNCDTLVRVSTPCETEYRPEDLSQDTVVTVTFDGESCSFETTTQPAGS